MQPSPEAGRIDSLDFLRGLAVMGIVLSNLPAFGLPEAAYFVPLAGQRTSPADLAAWFATYVLVEGKMRGLFSLLFGASMLLVIDRAEAVGRSGAAVHYRRMAVLFGIGCVHLYGLWWGDILAHYALCGALAFPLARLPVRGLIAVALLLIVWQAAQDLGLYAALLGAQASGTPGQAFVAEIAASFGDPRKADLSAELAAYRGTYLQAIDWRWSHESGPLTVLPALGPETLAAMLLGMAGLRSGFLTGDWSRARYRRWAAVCLGAGLIAYAIAGARTIGSGFALDHVVFGAWVLPSLIRSVPIVGYAALFILLMRPGGRLATRIAAVGRCALSNYLATTLVLTTLFYGCGLGLFGHLSRSELYLLVPPIWLGMLAWSRPWLSRHLYGPAEWLWRSLARGRVEPMRRHDEPLLRPMRK